MFFLGFVLALVAYYYLARYTVKAVAKRYPGKLARYFTITVFVFIPIWDVVPGHLYFSYLCGQDGGVKVFKTVEAEPSYFLPNGEPDQSKLSEAYFYQTKLHESFSPLFHITKSSGLLQERQNGMILGTATAFSYYGGWINANIFPQGPPSRCPDYLVHGALWTQVVKPRRTSSLGGN